MSKKKVYRIYIDRDSALFELLERLPVALRGEYVRLALTAFKPFKEIEQVDHNKKESKKTVVSSDTFG